MCRERRVTSMAPTAVWHGFESSTPNCSLRSHAAQRPRLGCEVSHPTSAFFSSGPLIFAILGNNRALSWLMLLSLPTEAAAALSPALCATQQSAEEHFGELCIPSLHPSSAFDPDSLLDDSLAYSLLINSSWILQSLCSSCFLSENTDF